MRTNQSLIGMRIAVVNGAPILAAAAISLIGMSGASLGAMPFQEEQQNPLGDRAHWIEELEPGIRVMGRVAKFGAAGRVHTFEVTPDGKSLVTGHDNQIVVWDIESGNMIAIAETGSISKLCFSKDGRLGAIEGEYDSDTDWKRRFLVFNLDDLSREGEVDLKNPVPSSYFPCRFSNDGETAWVATVGGELEQFDWRNRKHLRTIRTVGRTEDLAFTADEQSLLVPIAQPRQLRGVGLVDVESGALTERLFEDDLHGMVWNIAINDSAGLLLAVQRTKGLKLFEYPSGRIVPLAEAFNSTRDFLRAQISADGRWFGATFWRYADWKYRLIIGNARTGEVVGEIGDDTPSVGLFRFSPDGNSLYVAFRGQAGIAELDMPLAASLKTEALAVDAPSYRLSFSGDGRLLLSTNATGQSQLWSLETERSIKIVSDGLSYSGYLGTGNRVFGMAGDNQLLVLETDPDVMTIGTYDFAPFVSADPIEWMTAAWNGHPRPQSESLYHVRAYPLDDGRTIAVTGHSNRKGKYCLWDTEARRLVCTQTIDLQPEATEFAEEERPRAAASRIVPTKDGKYLGRVCDGKLALIEPKTGEFVQEWPLAASGEEYSLTFCPHQTIAACLVDNRLILLDYENGEILQKMSLGRLRYGHGSAEVQFSADGRRLLRGWQLDGRWHVNVYDTSDWSEIVSRTSSAGCYQAIAISHDGRMLAISQADSRIQVWDLDVLAARN
jgi:WD40 repeat protein